ncbi:M16 family metallopeptidase [Rubrivivax sp. RP6-9]|uniref:M16 family metallopeptidase n=1 Tax=Rubrivivax sp. RP6-9 TaxID=3415750 RepID=UPI003CC6A145
MHAIRTLAAGLALGWLLAAAPATAQPRPPMPEGLTEVTSVEGITEYRLANGLQLLLVPDAAKPTTTVNLTYRVGSRHENYGETGMAHLLEHLLFKGTPTHRNLLGEFSKRGLRANGTTWYDRTNYFASFSASDDNLRWYLGWLADGMVNSFIARSDLDTEMTVVRNEMERGENSPGRVLLQQTMAAMYTWHNYGKSTIGARSDVENVDIPRLQAFYREYYQPDNATLIVSGRFDPAKTLAWAVQAFGPLPRPQRVLVPTTTLDPPQDGERSVTVRRAGGAPQLYVAYHVPAAASADYAAAELLVSILGNAPAGRLHKRLVEGRLAAQTFGFGFGLAEPGPVFLGASLAPGQDVEQARTALLATLDALAAEPVTAEELRRAKTQWLNDWEQGFTDPETVGVQLSEAIARGDWRLYFLQRDQVQALTQADLQRVADAYLRPDNRTVGLYLPTATPQRAPAPVRADVAALVKDYRGNAAAAQAEAFEATPANLDARTRRSRLASGLQVALLPKGTRGGAVQARLRLRYGDVDSLRGLATVSVLAGSLVDKGGAGLTRQQISDGFDGWRAQVGFGADAQGVTVSISTTREHLPRVIERVGALLQAPAFPADALEELRRQWLAAIERQRTEPDALIANQLQRHGNPYPRGDLRHAPTFDDMVQDVNAVLPAQLQAFHRRFYSAAHGEFAAVGDMDPAAVQQALDHAFGSWRQPAAGALPYVRAPQPLVAVPPQRFVLRTPDKQNANLRAELALALNDSHADYPALLMANYLFGLSESSRLWTRIREKDGLSYDVRSVVDWNRVEPASRWIVTAIFAPQNRARVETALNEELARALREGFGAAELDAARAGLLNLLRLSRAQDDAVAGQLVQHLDLGRTFAFAQKLDDALAALTAEQVSAAFRRHIDAARWSIAWGGDFPAP